MQVGLEAGKAVGKARHFGVLGARHVAQKNQAEGKRLHGNVVQVDVDACEAEILGRRRRRKMRRHEVVERPLDPKPRPKSGHAKLAEMRRREKGQERTVNGIVDERSGNVGVRVCGNKCADLRRVPRKKRLAHG